MKTAFYTLSASDSQQLLKFEDTEINTSTGSELHKMITDDTNRAHTNRESYLNTHA